MSDVVISTSELSKTFGDRVALNKVTFDLPRGAFLSVFGANGAGKTTLLRVLCTLTRPTSGTASVLGVDLKRNPDDVRNRIGFVSHESMLYPDLTVEENLRFAANLYGVFDPDSNVRRMLDAVELTYQRLNRVRSLSRGMTQRLSIARAFIHDPELVFLDEPYSGLDSHAVEILDRLIDERRAQCGFCMVSHDPDKGYELCTHELILAKGRIAFFGEKDNVDRAEFDRFYQNYVGVGVD